jgi:hypothetical protein
LASLEYTKERVLYLLSRDTQVRALAERLLGRFADMVGDLPASADYHHANPGGLYRHSLEVALKALEEFEGEMKMEHRPDGTVDSFRSSRNRPRWQYATFIAALCHDLGKLFELEVRGRGETWCPIAEPYAEFGRRAKAPVASWRPDREHGAHAKFSGWLMPFIMTRDDIAYLGYPCLVDLALSLADAHSPTQPNPLAQAVSRGDQSSVEQDHPSLAAQPDSKIGLLLSTLQELIIGGEMGVNIVGGQIYVDGAKAALVVPIAISMVRDRLKTTRKIVLPGNVHLYNMLHHANLVEADEDTGLSVRTIKTQGKRGTIWLQALIFPTEKLIPKQILPTLRPTHFEITNEPVPQAAVVAED